MPTHSRDDTAPPLAGGDDQPAGPPLHVRALDAFETFYRQVGVVTQRIAELRVAFERLPVASVVLIAGDLHCAWRVLHARLGLLETVTSDDAGRELWTHPMMEVIRAQLQALLRAGAAYVSRCPEGRRVLATLRPLETTLAIDAQIAREMARNAPPSGWCAIEVVEAGAGSGPPLAIVGDPSRRGRQARCRKVRPWRRLAPWRPRGDLG